MTAEVRAGHVLSGQEPFPVSFAPVALTELDRVRARPWCTVACDSQPLPFGKIKRVRLVWRNWLTWRIDGWG